MATIRKVIAIVWLVIPPLALSALIHSIDPDVGGVRGLASPSTLASVVVFGIPVVGFEFVCLALAIRRRWCAFAVVGVAFSAAIAVSLALLQTPRPSGFAGRALPVFGGTVLVCLFLTAGVLLAVALGWPGKGRRSVSVASALEDK